MEQVLSMPQNKCWVYDKSKSYLFTMKKDTQNGSLKIGLLSWSIVIFW